MADFDLLESKVNTMLKYKLTKKFKDKFPSISFRTEESTQSTGFPNVFTRELQPIEMGSDVTNKTLNGIQDTMQITVTTNTSKSDCMLVAWECVNVLKGMSYRMVGVPNYNKISDVHTSVIRCQRIVCAGDNI